MLVGDCTNSYTKVIVLSDTLEELGKLIYYLYNLSITYHLYIYCMLNKFAHVVT